MTGAQIAQLIILLGPPALELAARLQEVWNTELTVDQVKELCLPAHKSYQQFIEEARARLNPKPA